MSKSLSTFPREPLFIDLEPSYGCNLRCRMCHVTYLENTTPKFLDIKKIDWSFVQNKDVSLGSIFEPTIHPDFNELIGFLNKENAKISFVTNAILLSLEKLDNLYNSNLNVIRFSFDGASQEKYEYIRQGSKYKHTVRRIGDFVKHFQNSGATFVINFTVCKYNMDEIIPAIDLWESLGIHTINLTAMVEREKDDFFTKNSLFEIRDRYKNCLEIAINYILKNNLRISLKSPYFSTSEIREKYTDHFFPPDVIASKRNIKSLISSLHYYYGYGDSPIPHQKCQSPLTTTRIDYDANVYICQVIKIGNLYKNTFEEIWTSPKRSKIISQLIDNPEQCTSCDYFRFCINAQFIDYEESDIFFSQNLLKNRSSLDIQLIAEGDRGFNILAVGETFYAIPQGEGEFSLDRIEKQDYSAYFIADDEAVLRDLIAEYRLKSHPSHQNILKKVSEWIYNLLS